MILIILIVITCVLFYDSVTAETLVSVKKCLEIIIPSLYGSMLVACLVTETGLHAVAGKIFSLPARYIFRMPPEIFSVFLISNVSGYPAGAKLLKNMLDKGEITESEFSRYCSCCYSSGPAFITGSAASFAAGYKKIGIIIFLSNITANLISAFISGRNSDIPPKSCVKPKCRFTCSAVLRSADSAAHGMLQMCSVITAFSVFKILIISAGIVPMLADIISALTPLSFHDSTAAIMSLTEITNISDFRCCTANVVSLMAALFSTGGVCVIMQIFYIAGSVLDRKKFILYRILSAFISYAVCFILYSVLCRDLAAAASSFEVHAPEQPLLPSVLLIIMSIMLVATDRCRNERTPDSI